MKMFTLSAGCAAALMFAGCVTNGPESAEQAVDPNPVTQFRDGKEFIGLTYAEMNKKLGKPVLVSEKEALAGVPVKAAYSQSKRLDIPGEVFYTKLGSRTVTETHPPRFYMTVTVVRACFDGQGRVTEAVVSTVDRKRTPCEGCSENKPCTLHECSDGKCACPAPCGCDTCAENKDLCYKMGCVPGEPCWCQCGGSCGCDSE